MSTEQHEALRFANDIEDELVAGMHKVGSTADCAAPVLRVQHALIVQMAEALEKCRFDSLNMKLADLGEISDAHAAATQYLKGPKT